jgi:hypothetical protein
LFKLESLALKTEESGEDENDQSKKKKRQIKE